MEKLKPSYITDVNVNYCSHFWKTIWQFFQKVKHSYHITQKFYSWVFNQEDWKHLLSENLVTNVHNSIIHERKKEVAQLCPTLCDPMDCSLPGSSVHGIFIHSGQKRGNNLIHISNEWISKMFYIHTMKYVLFSYYIKRWTTDTWYNMDEPWKHYARVKKPDTKAIYFIIPFLWTVQTGKLIETESRFVVPGSRGKGKQEWLLTCMGLGAVMRFFGTTWWWL